MGELKLLHPEHRLGFSAMGLKPDQAVGAAGEDQQIEEDGPAGLPPRRRDGHPDSGHLIIPDPVAVRRPGFEGIPPRIQIGIGDVAPGSSVDPAGIEPLHHVGVFDRGGGVVIQGRELERKDILPVREGDFFCVETAFLSVQSGIIGCHRSIENMKIGQDNRRPVERAGDRARIKTVQAACAPHQHHSAPGIQC